MKDHEKKCLFCRIGRLELFANIVWENEQILAFEDNAPQAPVHILLIPKEHIETVSAVDRVETPYMTLLTQAANQIAREKNLDRSGYRLVVNSGVDGGQSVFHLHMHLLGGRTMTWPPG